MRAVVQRVRRADVTVGGREIGAIGRGLVTLVCVSAGDDEQDATALAKKLAHLRIFPDEQGRMNMSVEDIGGAVLVVSQFTLCADVRRGNRPSFTRAAPPEEATRLVDTVIEQLRTRHMEVSAGAFGEKMLLTLVNEGPVTIVIDVVGGRVVER